MPTYKKKERKRKNKAVFEFHPVYVKQLKLMILLPYSYEKWTVKLKKGIRYAGKDVNVLTLHMWCDSHAVVVVSCSGNGLKGGSRG